MRLLNTSTYELRDFQGQQIPPYAILSHTWENDEVLYQHVVQGISVAQQHEGWSKIKQCCERAAFDMFDWVWIDTCCIDKSSSAELSEAINSMYEWYSGSRVCYAYLSDLVLTLDTRDDLLSRFSEVRWFTRGWTLQELIASKHVIFFNHCWQDVGTKRGLVDLLSYITRIDRACLLNPGVLRNRSIAQRMSWAASRETSRVEDQAYSLLGIFNVNLPLLYGEGSKAFRRLQLEILKESQDHSVFLWKDRDKRDGPKDFLAASPTAFRDSGQIVAAQWTKLSSGEFSVGNAGLQITLAMSRQPITISKVSSQRTFYLAILNCLYGEEGRHLALALFRTDRISHGRPVFIKWVASEWFEVKQRINKDEFDIYRHESNLHLGSLHFAPMEIIIEKPSYSLTIEISLPSVQMIRHSDVCAIRLPRCLSNIVTELCILTDSAEEMSMEAARGELVTKDFIFPLTTRVITGLVYEYTCPNTTFAIGLFFQLDDAYRDKLTYSIFGTSGQTEWKSDFVRSVQDTDTMWTDTETTTQLDCGCLILSGFRPVLTAIESKRCYVLDISIRKCKRGSFKYEKPEVWCCSDTQRHHITQKTATAIPTTAVQIFSKQDEKKIRQPDERRPGDGEI